MEVTPNLFVARYKDLKVADKYVLARFKVNDNISFGLTMLDTEAGLCYSERKTKWRFFVRDI